MADEQGGGGLPELIARFLIDEPALDAVLSRVETRFLTFETRVNRAISAALATDPDFGEKIGKGFKNVERDIQSIAEQSTATANQVQQIFDKAFSAIGTGLEQAIARALGVAVSTTNSQVHQIEESVKTALAELDSAREQATAPQPQPRTSSESQQLASPQLAPGVQREVGEVVSDATQTKGIQQRVEALRKLRDEFADLPPVVQRADKAIQQLTNDTGTLEERLNRALAGGTEFGGDVRSITIRRLAKEKELQAAKDELRDRRREEGPDAAEEEFAGTIDRISELTSVVKNLRLIEQTASEATNAFATQFKLLSQEAKDAGNTIQKVAEGVRIVPPRVRDTSERDAARQTREDAQAARQAQREAAAEQKRTIQEAIQASRERQLSGRISVGSERLGQVQDQSAEATEAASRRVTAAAAQETAARANLDQIRVRSAEVEQTVASATTAATNQEVTAMDRLATARARTETVSARAAVSEEVNARKVTSAEQDLAKAEEEARLAFERVMRSRETTAQERQAAEGNLAAAIDKVIGAEKRLQTAQQTAASAAARNSESFATAVDKEEQALNAVITAGDTASQSRQRQAQNDQAAAAATQQAAEKVTASQERLQASQEAAAQASARNAQVTTEAEQQQTAALSELAAAQAAAEEQLDNFASRRDDATKQEVAAAGTLEAALGRASVAHTQNAAAQDSAAQEVARAAAAQTLAEQNLAAAEQRVTAVENGTTQQRRAAYASLAQAQNQLATANATLTSAQTAQANAQSRAANTTQAAATAVRNASQRFTAAGQATQQAAKGTGEMHNNMLALLGVSRLLPGPLGQVVSGVALMTGAFRTGTSTAIAITGGLAALVFQLGATGLAFNKQINQERVLAEGLGLTVTEVRALDLVLKQSDGSVENFSIGIRNVSEAISGIGENSARAAQGLNVAFAGIQGFQDSGFKTKSTTEVLLKFLERLQDPAFAQSGLSNVLSSAVLGRNFDEIKGRASDVTEQFGKYQQKLKDQHITDQQAIADAHEQQKALADLNVAWSNLQVRLAKPLTGVINFIVNSAEKIAGFISGVLPIEGETKPQNKPSTSQTPTEQAITAVTDKDKVDLLVKEATGRIKQRDKLDSLNDLIIERKQIEKEKIDAQVKIDKDALKINEDAVITLRATLQRQKEQGATDAQIAGTVNSLAGIQQNVVNARAALLAGLQAQGQVDQEIGKLRGSRTQAQSKEATARQQQLEDLKESAAEALQELSSEQSQKIDELQGKVERNQASTFEVFEAREQTAEETIRRTTELLGQQIAAIDEQIATLRKNAVKFLDSGELNPDFDPGVEEEVLKLSRERGKLSKSLQKERLSGEREIAKLQIEALNTVAKADRNRLDFALRILDAEQQRIGLLQQFGGLDETQARARILEIDQQRLRVLEAQARILNQDLRAQLAGLGRAANAEAAQATAGALQAGQGSQAAAEVGAQVARDFIQKRLDSDTFIELRSRILENEQSRLQLQAQLQFTDSILGRISEGFGRLVDSVEAAADRLFNTEKILGKENVPLKTIEQQAGETANQINSGLSRALKGAKSLADIFLGQRVRKSLPELTVEAGEALHAEVFRAGSDFYVKVSDSATLLKAAADLIAKNILAREKKVEEEAKPKGAPAPVNPFANETAAERERRLALGGRVTTFATSPTVAAIPPKAGESQAVTTLKAALDEFRQGLVIAKQTLATAEPGVTGSKGDEIAIQFFEGIQNKIDEFTARGTQILSTQAGPLQNEAIRQLLIQMQKLNPIIQNLRKQPSSVFTAEGVKFTAQQVTIEGGVKPAPSGREAAFNDEQKRNRELTLAAARAQGASERVIEELFFLESAFKTAAQSPTGPRGVPQFTRKTAKGEGLVIDKNVDERLIPEKAIPAAVQLFQKLLTKYGGDYVLALTAYNQGEGVVDDFLKFKASRSEARGLNQPLANEAFPFTQEGRGFAATILGRSGVPGGQTTTTPLPALAPIPPVVPGVQAGITEQGKADFDRLSKSIQETKDHLTVVKKLLDTYIAGQRQIDQAIKTGGRLKDEDPLAKGLREGLLNSVGADAETRRQSDVGVLQNRRAQFDKMIRDVQTEIKIAENKIANLEERRKEITEQARVSESFRQVRDPFARPVRPKVEATPPPIKAQPVTDAAALNTQKVADAVIATDGKMTAAAVAGHEAATDRGVTEVKAAAEHAATELPKAIVTNLEQYINLVPLPPPTSAALQPTDEIKLSVQHKSKGFFEKFFGAVFNGLDSESDIAKNDAVSLGKRVTSAVFSTITDLISGFTASTAGGKVGGFGAAAGSVVGIFRPALGSLIGTVAGILGGVIDFIGGIYKARAQRIAAGIEKDFGEVMAKFRSGALELGDTIAAIKKDVEIARDQLTHGKTGKKGGKAAFAQLEQQASDQIAQLREQQKQIQDGFAKQLDLLRQDPGVRGLYTQVKDVFSKVKEYLNSFDDKAQALTHLADAEEYFRLSLGDLQHDTLDQLTDLLKAEANAERDFQKQRLGIINEGRVQSEFAAADERITRLFELEKQRAEEKLKAQKQEIGLEKQLSIIDKAIERADRFVGRFARSIDKLSAVLGGALGINTDLSGVGSSNQSLQRALELNASRVAGNSSAAQSINGNLNINMTLTAGSPNEAARLTSRAVESTVTSLGLINPGDARINQSRPLVP